MAAIYSEVSIYSSTIPPRRKQRFYYISKEIPRLRHLGRVVSEAA